MDKTNGHCTEARAPSKLGRLRIPDHVVRRQFGEQTVILNLETGHYHGVNATGGRILDVIDETNDAQQAACRVADEFGASLAQVSADVARLCGELLERGLVVVDDG